MQASRWKRGWVIWLVALLAVLIGIGAAGIAPAYAATDFNLWVPLQDDFDSCTGERVAMTGTQHIVGRITEDGAGRMHFGFTRNTHATGIGQSSGARYILIDAVGLGSFEVVPGEARTFTQEYQSQLVRQGETAPDDDTALHFLTKITIDATGNVAVSIETERVACQ
jgi:hypothetical protein